MIRITSEQAAKLTGKRRAKYNAKRTEYNGVMYHSKAEADFAAELDLRLKAGNIISWDRQVLYVIVVYGKRICKLKIDFRVIHANHEVELCEVKGVETREWKLKEKLFRAQYPSVKLTVIKRGKPCKA